MSRLRLEAGLRVQSVPILRTGLMVGLLGKMTVPTGKFSRHIFSLVLGVSLAGISAAQTFEIGKQPAPSPNAPKNSAKKGKQGKGKSSAGAAQESSGGIGWGSSIEVGGMARAAQQALD